MTTATMPTPLRLVFVRPTVAISENEAKGAHWARIAASTKPWGDAAYYLTRNALIRREWPRDARIPVTIRVDIPFTKVRRRDPHNYVGTVVKAVVDGIVRAGLVPDDNPEWVSVEEPTLVIHPRHPKVTVHITPRETTT